MKTITKALILSIILLSLAETANAQETSDEEEQLVALINAARAEAGLPPVVSNPELAEVARNHSADMAQNRFFSHESPTTGDLANRLREARISFRAAGENIAYDTSVEAAHQAFMNSEGHRANVLRQEFDQVGVGIVHFDDRIMVTQAFMRSPEGSTASQQPAASEAQGATQAPEATGGDPAPTPGRAIPSPFDLLSMLTGRTQPAPAQPETPAPAPSAQPQPVPQPPGLYLVLPDGSWQRLELDQGTLIQLLAAAAR